MYIFKKDQYRADRGNRSRILDITCSHCSAHITYYQKDGPGELKRLYADRFIDTVPPTAELICSSCKRVVGIEYVYEKESRWAYRLFAGAVLKKITKSSEI